MDNRLFQIVEYTNNGTVTNALRWTTLIAAIAHLNTLPDRRILNIECWTDSDGAWKKVY